MSYLKMGILVYSSDLYAVNMTPYVQRLSTEKRKIFPEVHATISFEEISSNSPFNMNW